MFQDGSGGGPTDSPLTRGVAGVRTRVRDAVTAPCEAVRPSSCAPERPEAGRRGKRPRSRSASTSAAYNTPRREAQSYLAAGLVTAAESVVAFDARRKCTLPRERPGRERVPSEDPGSRWAPSGRAEFPGATKRIHPFDSMRFHVLLNSLFKVLFNFPSRYLSAIGLVPVFSLRWSLPPALGCIPKQPDSKEARSHRVSRRKGLTPALGKATIRRT